MPDESELNFTAMITRSKNLFNNKLLFAGEDFSKTYRDFYEDIYKLSAYMLENGFKNKKIGIYASNSYYWVLLFFATAMNVGIIAPLDKELPENELKTSTKRMGLDFIFCDDSTAQKTQGLEKDITLIHINEIQNIISEQELPTSLTIPVRECVALFLTSGTTSQSKIVMLSEKNLVACAYSSALAFTLHPRDKYYTILPLHHTLTLMCAVLVPITNGCSFCFSKNIKDMQKEMVFYKPTALVVVPRLMEFVLNNIKMTARRTHKEKTMAVALKISKVLMALHIDLRRKIFRSIHAKFGGKVRMIACGGAELDQRIFNELDDLGFNIYQGYGLTESSPILTIRGMFVKSKIGVGKPLPGVELKIKDPDSQGVGEITARAAQVMMGYYKDQESTKKVLKNGWLYTGDLGRIHEDGNLEIVGREKNLIIASNGKNVYPEELETLINYSDLVKESVVSGVKKGAATQIVATIVPEEKVKYDSTLENDIAALIKQINTTLPDYKHINKYVIQLDEFKKTTTLKIKRGAQ